MTGINVVPTKDSNPPNCVKGTGSMALSIQPEKSSVGCRNCKFLKINYSYILIFFLVFQGCSWSVNQQNGSNKSFPLSRDLSPRVRFQWYRKCPRNAMVMEFVRFLCSLSRSEASINNGSCTLYRIRDGPSGFTASDGESEKNAPPEMTCLGQRFPNIL
ncbi:uncharacterized protein LOC129746000 isoform X1 [Uranotaenia lowii]|uniref:uncharacterized protein LOC129746000 isoform X1 n=1 Tax=Uranotaenia lowii TaxID=190385 RepID=UPI00247B2749|nr:uncharacterized protein LOC129746000 isoform X1 [Uranotaenia lowii]